jgi:hypothetical protein
MKITRTDVGFAFVSFAFWGFLGSLAFSGLYGTFLNPAQALINPTQLPFVIWWGTQLTAAIIPLLFVIVGFGLNRIIGLRRPVIALGGLIAGVLFITNQILEVTPSFAAYAASPYYTIVGLMATGSLFIALTAWLLSSIEAGSNSAAVNLMSGWGGVVVAVIIGAIADLGITIAGYSSFTWGMIFANCIPLLMVVGGLLIKESGPAAVKAKQVDKAAKQ